MVKLTQLCTLPFASCFRFFSLSPEAVVPVLLSIGRLFGLRGCLAYPAWLAASHYNLKMLIRGLVTSLTVSAVAWVNPNFDHTLGPGSNIRWVFTRSQASICRESSTNPKVKTIFKGDRWLHQSICSLLKSSGRTFLVTGINITSHIWALLGTMYWTTK